ncbi:unnamed protein product [Paramecium octaurelia]|uniref:Uncharacterized protein n=1 Tax=Paramecium octaurelia TaxID=43137 RepID=A0A8S1S038_PAROT|nr:unnamed protein product [Paramecium octaurelia]
MRPISSALKLKTNDSSEKRLRSAVQFKLADSQKLKNVLIKQSQTSQQSLSQQSRLQSGTTYNTSQRTGYSTHRMNEAEYDSGSSSAFRGQIKMRSTFHSSKNNLIRRVDSQFSLDNRQNSSPQDTNRNAIPSLQNRLFQQGGRSPQKQLIVTQENMDSYEVKRRMKFDPQIKQQVIYFKILNISNIGLKNYLFYLYKQQKCLIDLVKSKAETQLIDFSQQILTFSIGTLSPIALIETLSFSASMLESTSQLDWAIFYHNQTRIMANYAKQTMDKYKMKSLIGLGNCSIKMQQYEIGIKFFKKCLQYSWLNNDLDYENEVYSKLGVCYYYLGDIEKVLFQFIKTKYYHERAITYDYEIESSPLRQMSSDTLKIFLSKNFTRNYAETINTPLLNRLNLPLPQDILQISKQEIQNESPTMINPRTTNESKVSSTRRNSIFESNPHMKMFSAMQVDGLRIQQEILSTQEFEVEIYTPKHSFKSESKCFDFIRNKKIHPQDIFHDIKYKTNPFILSDLGVISGQNDENPIENPQMYKLPLDQQIDIRLKKKTYVDIQSKLKKLMDYKYHTKTQMKNKILITHRNIENEKRHYVVDQNKVLESVQRNFENLIENLMNQQ